MMEVNDKPYMLLKFGRIKYADFSSSPESMAIHDNSCDSKLDMVNIIRTFNGDFHLWWEDVKCTKEEAINYILNHETT